MDNKEACLKFLEFCCALAVYPTKSGEYIMQATQDKEGHRQKLTPDELFDAFENNKLEELLSGATIKTDTMDVNEPWPKNQRPYNEKK